MQIAVFLFFAVILLLPGYSLKAEPPAKNDRIEATAKSRQATDRGPSRAQLIDAANGWVYANGEWVHPGGYKFVNNKIIRTTARSGHPLPKPPGKLALENPTKLTARPKSAAEQAQTAAEKAAEQRRKNLEPRPAPQTGTHL